MAQLREVLVLVSSKQTMDTYLSRSYPNDDFNRNGKIELYRTPVYQVNLQGTDAQGKQVVKVWKALRFMPYWNDPKQPDSSYKSLGWINSGKHAVPRKCVTLYKPDYGTHNRYSPYAGAIQIEGSFLIHAGPRTLSESGWGAAGCVEIIGDFDLFKNDIKVLSGSTAKDAGDAILELVKNRKLFVKVEYATPPNLKANLHSEISVP